MAGEGASYWLESTPADRQALYAVAKRLVDLGSITWNEFYAQTLKRSVGAAYPENFRKGKNSRKDAAQMYEFLRRNFPDAARELDRVTGNVSSWASFRDAHEKPGLISVIAVPRAGAPRFLDPPGFRHIHTGEPFLLQIDAPMEGYALCFRERHEFTFLQPLSGKPYTVLHGGREWLTKGADDITPAPIFTPEERLFGELFTVIVGELGLIESLLSGYREGYPLPENYFHRFPGALAQAASPWVVTSHWATYSGIPYDEK